MAQPQIGGDLFFVQQAHPLHGFQLHDDTFFDQHVELQAGVQLGAFEQDRQLDIRFDGDDKKLQ